MASIQAPTRRESFLGTFKYPLDLAERGGPHEKWIMIEARSGRHIMRGGFVAEDGNKDRTLAAVALYLPTDALKSAHTVGYKDIDVGIAAGKAVEAAFQREGTLRAPTQATNPGWNVDQLLQSFATTTGVIGQLTTGMGMAGSLAALELVGKAVVESPTETFEIIAGKAVNPRTDTAFDAMQYRTHEFTFNLIPRTKEEADEIDKILNILHYYSLPSYGDTTGVVNSLINFMIGYPYEFVITMFDETHINKIERSVLTGITVDHAGGDRIAFASSKGADETEYYPAATTLSLSFKEVRLLGRDSEVILRAGGAGIDKDPRGPENVPENN